MTEKLIVIPAQAGIHPFAIFPFARSANGNLLPKMANHCGGESRRELDGDFISPSFSRLRESNRAFGAVIIAQAIIAAFLLFARSANHLAKQDGKMRLCVAPQNAA